MDNVDKFLSVQNDIIRNFNHINSLNDLDRTQWYRSLYSLNASLMNVSCFRNELGVQGLQEEVCKIKKVMDPINMNYKVFTESLASQLDSYRKISDLAIFSRQMTDVFEASAANSINLQSIASSMVAITRIPSVSDSFYKNISLLSHLQEVIGTQIDTSLWDYYESAEELEDDIDEDVVNEILIIAEDVNSIEKIKQFINKRGEVGKRIIVKVFFWFFVTLISGFVNYCCEPIYKIIAPTFLRQQEGEDSTNMTEIPANTEIHVWSSLTNNYIEVSYNLDGQEFQGYITKEELEEKSEKISSKVELEHIIFISDIVELLAEHWGINQEKVYAFLKEDTSIIDTYVLEHYPVLKELDEGEMIEVLEMYCEDNNINLPQATENID